MDAFILRVPPGNDEAASAKTLPLTGLILKLYLKIKNQEGELFNYMQMDVDERHSLRSASGSRVL